MILTKKIDSQENHIFLSPKQAINRMSSVVTKADKKDELTELLYQLEEIGEALLDGDRDTDTTLAFSVNDIDTIKLFLGWWCEKASEMNKCNFRFYLNESFFNFTISVEHSSCLSFPDEDELDSEFDNFLKIAEQMKSE